MRTFTLCAHTAAILAIAACACLAEEKPAPPPAPPVEKLLEQLRSDDFEQREKAQALLSQAGEPARAAIEKALKAPRAEADFVTRAQRALEAIDADNHLRRFDTVKRIDLQIAGTLREALDQLKADFKCVIAVESEENESFEKSRVDVSVKNATFFEALEAIRVAAKAGYTHHQAPNMYPVALCELKSKMSIPAASAGQFLFFANAIETNVERTVNFNNEKPEVQQRLSFNATLAAAPGVRFSAIGLHAVTLSDATPEVFHCNASISPNSGNDDAPPKFNISINTDYPQALKAPLALKFEVVAMVPTRIEEATVALAPKADASIKLANGATLTLKPAEKKERRGWEIAFTADCLSNALAASSERRSIKVKKKIKDPDDDNDEDEIDESIVPTQDAVCSAGIYFVDAAGRKHLARMNLESNSETQCKGRFMMNDEPKAILVRSLTGKEERKIPIEVKGIPVP